MIGDIQPKVTLECIGRVDSLGTPHPYGSHIGFVYEIPGSTRHTIVIEEMDAEELAIELGQALWPDGTDVVEPREQTI